ncbi:MAG TPA: hypothetical protein VGM92_03565, partial [Candidatus Kapabacteria bacterium]
MKRFLTLLATGALSLGLSSVASAQLTRPFGAGALVLDDNHSHTVVVSTPPYDAGPYTFPPTTAYDAWEEATFPVLNWYTAIPPFANAQAGFLFPGPLNQTAPASVPFPLYTLSYWVGPGQAGFNNNGGYAGAWDNATTSQLGLVTTTCTGIATRIPVFTGTSTLCNSSITDNGTVITTSEPVGIGLNNPTGALLTNAPVGTNVLGGVDGETANSFIWTNATGGYVGAFRNSVNAPNNDGLVVNIASNSVNSFALNVNQNNALLFGVQGNGNVSIDPNNVAATTIGNTTAGTQVTIAGATSINTSGAGATSIGNGTNAITITGTNGINGPTTVTGNTSVNTSGAGTTSIGNGTNAVTITGTNGINGPTTITGVTAVDGTTTINNGASDAGSTTIGNVVGTNNSATTIDVSGTGNLVLNGLGADPVPTQMLTLTNPGNQVRVSPLPNADEGVVLTTGEYRLGSTLTTGPGSNPFLTNRNVNLDASNLNFTSNGGAQTPVLITGGVNSGVALATNGTGTITATGPTTVTGNTSVNTSGAGTTSIGNGTNAITITGTNG